MLILHVSLCLNEDPEEALVVEMEGCGGINPVSPLLPAVNVVLLVGVNQGWRFKPNGLNQTV